MDIKCRFNGKVLFGFKTDKIKVCLEMAVKSGANLSRADLSGANLYGADLSGANLSRANLYGAYLSGAKYGEGIPLENIPLQLQGTNYDIIVMDTHIKIGCKLYKHTEWESFTDEEISRMDSGALEWWNEWKGLVLSLSLGHQQRIAKKGK